MQSPQSTEIKDEVYLGKVTTKIIRQTEIPLLVVPKDYLFRKLDIKLFAFKNTKIQSTVVSETLQSLLDMFHAKMHLLQVVTPDTALNNHELQQNLQDIKTSHIRSKNATVFQAIVEHFNVINSELMVVLRRRDKGGFFRNLLKQDEVILKEHFFTTKPLLILKEAK